MSAGDMPEIEMITSEDSGEQLNTTPFILRRFVWDVMPCSEVTGLLPALGLTVGSQEGLRMEHVDSHRRIARTEPLSAALARFAEILGVLVSVAMTEKAGVDLGEDSVKFAEQNQEVIEHACRAIIAQFIDTGVLAYGPNISVLMGGEGV